MSYDLSPTFGDSFDFDLLGYPPTDAGHFPQDTDMAGSDASTAYPSDVLDALNQSPATATVDLYPAAVSAFNQPRHFSSSTSEGSGFTVDSPAMSQLHESQVLHEDDSLLAPTRPHNTRRRRAPKRYRASSPTNDHATEHYHHNKRRQSRSSITSSAPSMDDFDDEFSSTKKSQLEKNRVAASKCRQKQKKHVQSLEAREKELESQREALLSTSKGLQDEVLILKNEILKHGFCNCSPIQNYITTTAKNLV